MDHSRNTPKALLAALEGREDSPAEPDREADPFEVSLVRLQPEGTKRPFFCVHPASGTVGVFFDVAQRIDSERPFFAFQPPGIDGECEPFFHLRALARGYVRQMRSVQPKGPYTLGGWSAGGLIAFQMAHELRASGEDVALLVLCDTVSNDVFAAMPHTREEIATFVHQQMAMMIAHLAKQRGKELDASATFDRLRTARPGSLRSRADRIFELLHEAGVFRTIDSQAFKALRKVYRANLVAVARYRAPKEPLDAPITLLRCKNDDAVFKIADECPSYGWSTKTMRSVDVIEMPSHHYALFQGEVAPITAHTLRSLLDAADRP